MDLVPLNRTFRRLSPAVDTDAYDVDNLPFTGEQLTWRDLLERPRIVILAEAGAGKTAEIREIARLLRSEGKAAFFIRLEHAADDVESAFEEGSFEDFQTWLAGSEEGWLLLDSIDEARLRSPHDFDRAIRKIGRQTAPALTRSHVVITGRPHAWRAKTDLALCERHLPFNPERKVVEREHGDDPEVSIVTKWSGDKVESACTIVALNDLSPAQIQTFAAARGVKEVKAFTDAVERAEASSFTARPQDLEELLEFWIANGGIGTRRELMHTSVRRRLQEPDPSRAEAWPLSLSRAETGARLIAAACTLVRTATIEIPSGDAGTTVGVALGHLLHEWDQREQATLLARPVFDEAIYGAVRFHHRSVREYLCAEWFAELLKQQTSRRAIEQILFREQYGLEVVVPETRPILPWLSIFDGRICARVERLAPEVFFEGGDPSALPFQVRLRILRDVVEQIVSGTTSRTAFDNVGVARFATPELTDEVRRLIRAHSGNSDVLWLLLRMVWQGRLAGALPEVKAVALCPTTEHYARIAAFRAVDTVGEAADMVEVRLAFAEETGELDRGWIAELISNLVATVENLAWLFDVVAKSRVVEPHTVDNLSYALDEFVDRLPEELLAPFMDGAAHLLGQPPFVERRHGELSQRFSWVLQSAGAAVLKVVERRSADALRDSTLGVLQKIPIGQRFDDADVRDVTKRLAILTPAWPDLKWALFWRLVDNERRWLDPMKAERLTDFGGVPMWSAFVRFDTSDFERALQNIESRTLLDDRLVALSLAFAIYVQAERPLGARRRLKQIVSGVPELERRLSELLKPLPQSAERRKVKRMTAAWERRAQAHQEKARNELIKAKRYLEENLERAVRAPTLNSPDAVAQPQAYLLDRARQSDKDSTHFARNIWRALIPEFGEPIATAFRDGAVAYWRRRKPKLLSEGAPLNTTNIHEVFGLVGLSIEASERSDWLASLSFAEAELAFRFAMHELNGFPPWLPHLYERFPHLVRDLSLKEIRFELASDNAEHDGNYLLSDVSWSGHWMWDSLAPDLLETVTTCEPKNLEKLRQVLTVLQGSSLPDAHIARVAQSKALIVEAPDHAATWFAVWVGVDPGKALPAVQARLESIVGRAEALHFAMVFVAQLVGTQLRRSAARRAYQTADHLKTLYLLVGSYVSEDEDVERAGKGVYSPGLRDAAQDARNALFAVLRELRGKDAFVAMMDVAQRHADPAMQESARRYAHTKAENDANGEPWTVRQVREFNDALERTPSNHRELFDLAVMRLQDLKDDLENGDASEAAVLMRINDETELRNVLGSRLRLTAHGRYTIPQEEEFADAKRPDLRFHAAGVDAPVPVELKLSHRWTARQLLERLENQLCRDYLRDIRSSRGLFVLVHQGQKQTWELPDGSAPVDFAGLLAAIAKHWAAVSNCFPDIDEIRVCGIDLTKRSTRPRRLGKSSRRQGNEGD